jgi:hypothetical protein
VPAGGSRQPGAPVIAFRICQFFRSSQTTSASNRTSAGSDIFDRAVTGFAAAYAEQNERGYHALVIAVASGR